MSVLSLAVVVEICLGMLMKVSLTVMWTVMWKSVVALVLDYLPDLDLGREEEDDIDDEDQGM